MIDNFSKKLVEYDTAWLYAATLFHDNKSDWRLPTQDEWIRDFNSFRYWYKDRDQVNAHTHFFTKVVR